MNQKTDCDQSDLASGKRFLQARNPLAASCYACRQGTGWMMRVNGTGGQSEIAESEEIAHMLARTLSQAQVRGSSQRFVRWGCGALGRSKALIRHFRGRHRRADCHSKRASRIRPTCGRAASRAYAKCSSSVYLTLIRRRALAKTGQLMVKRGWAPIPHCVGSAHSRPQTRCDARAGGVKKRPDRARASRWLQSRCRREMMDSS